MAKTAYQTLVSRKSSYCKGKVTKSAVKKAASAYVKNAVSKAKKNGESPTKAKVSATAKANRILRGGCKTTTVITGRKKSKAKSRAKKRK